MRHRRMRVIVSLLALTLLLAAAPELTAQPRTPVKIAVLRAAFVYFTPYVAEAKGFFAQHGLDAQLIYFRSGAETTTAVVSGSTEFGALATEHVTQVREQGLRLKAIVANLADSPFTLIVRKEVELPNAARGYPHVVRDLKGLKLGITGRGASTDFTLRFLVKEAGLDPDKDVTIIATGGIATSMAALQKGDIQGYLAFEPIQSQAIHGLGIAKPVIDIRKGEGPRLLQEYAYNSMVAKEEYLDANPETARRMVAAVLDTHRFLADPKNFEETVKVAEKYFEGINPALLRQILQESLKAYRPVITRQAVANIGEMLRFAGLVKRAPAYEEVVDTRYAPTRFP
ncbi:MAG: ABC transporter substrate-binding protein [Candidatus Rokubacteria bacterium]|nr:ABC transporter substrate-binding protein [Candidatus Rokubacteria bacterium]